MATTVNNPCDEAGLLAKLDSAPCTERAAPWVLTATVLASSMAFIDASAVNVALPVLQDALGADVVQVQWVIESYALFLAALLLVGGALGDRFGRKRIFSIGVVSFALASSLCGLAQTVEQLIWARGLQGVAAALLVPGSLAILSSSFPDERKGMAIGTWSAFTAMTTALGPVLGGWLIENASWRWIFYLNIPIALIVLFLTNRAVRESGGGPNRAPLDWRGATLATLGLGSITFGLVEATARGFTDPLVLGTVIAGVITLIAFLVFESRVSNPMLPLSLFQSSNFSGANILTLFLYAPLNGLLFFMPFNLVQVQGYSPTQAGAAFLPLILAIFLFSRWAGGLPGKYGPRLPLIAGPIIAAIGYGLFAVSGIGQNYWISYFPGLLVLGFGMAVSIPPLTTLVMVSVEEDRTALASGINNTASRSAGVLAVAIYGIIMLAVFNSNLDREFAAMGLSPEFVSGFETERIKLAAAEIPQGLEAEARREVGEVIKASFLSGFRFLMWFSVVLSLLSALSAFIWIRHKQPAGRSIKDTDR